MILTLVLFLGVLSGCGTQEQASEEKETSPKDQPKTSTEEKGEQKEEKELSLSSILSKTSELKSAEYDLSVTPPNQEIQTAHMWWKGDNMKISSSIETQAGTFNGIYFMNTETKTARIYLPDQNRAIKIDYSKAQKETADSPVEKNQEIQKHDTQILRRETINNKDCVVVQYNTEEGEEIKVWIWEKHGLPVKTVASTDQGEYVTELNNIEFGEIPDQEFELPEGIQVIELPGGMGF